MLIMPNFLRLKIVGKNFIRKINNSKSYYVVALLQN